MADIFGPKKLSQLLGKFTEWVNNFIEIVLSSMVVEIQAFLCFTFLKKNLKIPNGLPFW